MHHSYLIVAPRKHALLLAKEWVSKNTKLTPQSPDILVFDVETVSVDTARHIGRAISGRPFGSDGKVVIVTAGNMLHRAQNALLKVLEEPPLGTTIILSVPDKESLLNTVCSRLIQLDTSVLAETHASDAFLSLSKDERKKFIKKLLDDTTPTGREEALSTVRAIVDALIVTYGNTQKKRTHAPLLSDLLFFKTHLAGNAPALKMVLEELAIRLPEK